MAWPNEYELTAAPALIPAMLRWALSHSTQGDSPLPLKRFTCSGSLNQCVLLFYTSNKRETFCVRSHTVKSIWKCRPAAGRHFDVGFINQALLAKVSLLDKAPFCGTVKPQPKPENPTDKMKQMSIMANPIMSGDSLVFLTTAHNRAMSSHVQNRLSTDTYVTQRPNLLRENGYVV